MRGTRVEFELDSGRVVSMAKRTSPVTAVEWRSTLFAHVVGELLGREGGSVLNLCTSILSPVTGTLTLDHARGLTRVDLVVQDRKHQSDEAASVWFKRGFGSMDAWWIGRQALIKQLAALSLLILVDPGGLSLCLSCCCWV